MLSRTIVLLDSCSCCFYLIKSLLWVVLPNLGLQLNTPIKEIFFMFYAVAQVDGGNYEAYCSECLKPIGMLTRDEFRFLVGNGLPLVGFCCDSVNADKVPDHLFCEDLHFMLLIAGQWFSVNWPNLARAGGERVSYYQAVNEDLRARLLEIAGRETPLSSSSKSAAVLGESDV